MFLNCYNGHSGYNSLISCETEAPDRPTSSSFNHSALNITLRAIIAISSLCFCQPLTLAEFFAVEEHVVIAYRPKSVVGAIEHDSST